MTQDNQTSRRINLSQCHFVHHKSQMEVNIISIEVYKGSVAIYPRVKWVPATTAWRVLKLRMEERPPIWRVAANILNRQSRAGDKGWSSSWGVGRGANKSSLLKRVLLRNIHRQSLGPGLIIWYDISNERET